jgi:hypothetical protein
MAQPLRLTPIPPTISFYSLIDPDRLSCLAFVPFGELLARFVPYMATCSGNIEWQPVSIQTCNIEWQPVTIQNGKPVTLILLRDVSHD